MAPTVLIALMLLAADEDAPVATQAPRVTTAPLSAPLAAPAPQAPSRITAEQLFVGIPVDASPPEDDYGYVAWCYGALSTYVSLYERAMPEVTRIENEFPSPEGVENALKVYPALRLQARADLKLYAAATQAAEKATPKLIAPYGEAATQRGRSIWDGALSAPKAKLAQMWMSWSPPDRCEVTARKLKTRASVLGAALAAETPDVSALGAPTPPTEAPATPPSPAPATKSDPSLK